MIQTLSNLIHKLTPETVKIRQSLHQIPELKFSEFKTAALIAATLQSHGYEIKTGIGKTGIITLLDSGKPGKTVALRADIDALPIHNYRCHTC